MEVEKYRTEEGEFKGRKILSIYAVQKNTGKNIRIASFGVNKAIAIIDRIDDIKAFIERNKEN